LPVLTVLLALAVACGSDNGGGITGGGGSAAWDVSKADDLAHAALLQASELPGSGWTATDDDFDQHDEPMVGACSDFDSFKKNVRSATVERAKRSLAKAGASRDDFGTEVETTVTIFKDSKTANDTLSRWKNVSSSDKFITCFQEQLKSDVGSNATVAIRRVNATASAPSGGSALALDVDLRAGREQLQAQTENYVWANGNAVIQINVTSTKASFNADVFKQAVAKQDQAARDAVKGTRQPTAATPGRR
jgi:hypothetical protein